MIYTEEEQKFILENWEKMSNPELGKALGRGADSIRKKLKQMGLKRTKSLNKKRTIPSAYSEKELQFIRDNYKTMSPLAMSKKLKGRSKYGIEMKLKQMGLFQSEPTTVEDYRKFWCGENKLRNNTVWDAWKVA